MGTWGRAPEGRRSSSGASIDATTKLQTLQMEREDNRHRQLIDSIDNVAQTVEDSSAFAQGKNWSSAIRS